jgi:hypothetical protein
MQFINLEFIKQEYINKIIQIKLLYLILAALGTVLISSLTTALVCNQLHSASKPVIQTITLHEKCIPKCINLPPQKKAIFKKNQLVPVTNGRQF